MSTYPKKRFLTVNAFYEAAKAFGTTISKPKIYEACESGSMKAYQQGNSWRIEADEVVDYFDRQIQESRGLPTAKGFLGTPKRKDTLKG